MTYTPNSTQINQWGIGEPVTRSQLGTALRRFIRDKEKYLNRRCCKMWYFQNRLDEWFIFGNFCRNYDRLLVTVAQYVPNVGWLPPK